MQKNNDLCEMFTRIIVIFQGEKYMLENKELINRFGLREKTIIF